jgi:hypothetical protein
MTVIERTELENILEQEEYQAYYKNESSNLLQKWFIELFDWLKRFFPELDVSGEDARIIAYIASGIIALILIAFIVWLIRKIIMRQSLRESPLLDEDDLNQTEGSYWRLARQAEENKQWKEGVRFAYYALLLYLDHREWIKAERWKTNREYVDELDQNQPDHLKSFRSLAVQYERFWYGKYSCGENQCASFLSEVKSIIGEGKAHEVE